MYGKMQESELTEIIPLICTSAIWGQCPVFHILSFLRAHRRELLQSGGCLREVFFPSWVPSGLTSSPSLVWLQSLMAVTSLFTDMAGSIPFLNCFYLQNLVLRCFLKAFKGTISSVGCKCNLGRYSFFFSPLRNLEISRKKEIQILNIKYKRKMFVIFRPGKWKMDLKKKSINVFAENPKASVFSKPSLPNHLELWMREFIQWNQFIFLQS